MNANDILILVIGLFFMLAGTLYLVELRKLKDVSKAQSAVAWFMVALGVFIASWASKSAIDSKIVPQTRPSKLMGQSAYDLSKPRNSGSYEEASALYEKGVSFWSEDLVGYDSTDIALTYFDRSIAIFETAEAYTVRGQLKVQLGAMREALADYNRAIQLKEDFGNAYYNRATVYYIMGNTQLACEDWKKAHELGIPNTAEVLASMCN